MAPLHFPSSRRKFSMRSGREEISGKAKPPESLKGDWQSFDCAKATHEAGSAVTPGLLLRALSGDRRHTTPSDPASTFRGAAMDRRRLGMACRHGSRGRGAPGERALREDPGIHLS